MFAKESRPNSIVLRWGREFLERPKKPFFITPFVQMPNSQCSSTITRRFLAELAFHERNLVLDAAWRKACWIGEYTEPES